MTRKELSALCGNLEQIIYARHITYADGPAKGLNAVEVQNGLLRFTVLTDRCLDISEMSYRGINIGFLSKSGLTGTAYGSKDGAGSIIGGLMFTAGLENIGPSCRIGGKSYPMHGSIRHSPAKNIGITGEWCGEEYILTIAGEIRQAELFGKNVVLRRTISTTLGSPVVSLQDTIENKGFAPEQISLLYHCNVGYPLLDEGTRILLPSLCVNPRDEISAQGIEHWQCMSGPINQKHEEVFIHELSEDRIQLTPAAAVNDRLGIGLLLRYSQKNLPYFYQWKSEASGDYALGLEPSNADIRGLKVQTEQGCRGFVLQPFEKEVFQLQIGAIDGSDEISAIETTIQSMCKRK